MHRRIVSLLATGALLASVGVLVGPGAAVAEDPPPPPVPAVPDFTAPEPIVSPTSGPPGTVITVTVPDCTGIVTAAIGTEEGDIIAFIEGQGPTVHLTVPANTPQGEVAIVAGCDIYDVNDINGVIFTVTAGAVVASPQLTG